MVSYSNIPITLLALSLLLLSPPFLHKPHNLVAADEQLILAECHGSHNRTMCVNCVKSDRLGKKADKVGIATIVVNCISKHGNNIVSYLTMLNSNEKEQKLKDLFEDCITKYSINKNLLAAAQQAIQDEGYEIAATFVSQTIGFSNACCHHIENVVEQILAVSNDIILYEELSLDAMRIIQGLH